MSTIVIQIADLYQPKSHKKTPCAEDNFGELGLINLS
jgi:hypothetical protein